MFSITINQNDITIILIVAVLFLGFKVCKLLIENINLKNEVKIRKSQNKILSNMIKKIEANNTNL